MPKSTEKFNIFWHLHALIYMVMKIQKLKNPN